MATRSPIGMTAAFTTSSYVLNIVSMTPPDQPINDLATSTLATTGFRTYIPGSLEEPGEQEMMVLHDPDTEPDKGTVDTLTITWPLYTGQITAANYAGTGYVKNYVIQELTAEDDQPVMALLTWKWDGETGPTLTVST
jgi:hypothetical protein